jgi:hydrogenase maturation protease
MTALPKLEVLVIGVGNPLRGDDAAGPMVARRIRDRQLPFFRAIEHDGEGASLMEAWTGAQIVIVVDAVSSNARPGTICRFDVTQQPLRGNLFQDSTHSFGVHQAVELSRVLNRLPQQLLIYGINGKSFDVGAPLSPGVEEAIGEVVQQILEEPGVRACAT